MQHTDKARRAAHRDTTAFVAVSAALIVTVAALAFFAFLAIRFFHAV